MKVIIPFLLCFCCALAAPAWKAELSPPTPGHHPDIASSTLDFTLSWKGTLNAGKLRMEFAPKSARKPGVFVTKCTASSLGAVAKLYPYSLSYWSEIHPGTLNSKYFHATEDHGKETVVTTNRYSSGKVSVSEITTLSKTGAVSTDTFSFPIGPARDLISAILYVRSQKLDPGEEHTLLLMPFRTPYLLKVKVEAKEQHLGRDALRISFGLRKIDRNSLALVPYKKLKKPVTLWLSNDADRIPIELRASVYIGDVRAVLTHFSKTP
ncbi:MAG: hypothetical protein RLZZ505_73 [Verrucomicrobiota bacterium]|jgi:hypothetical protein